MKILLSVWVSVASLLVPIGVQADPPMGGYGEVLHRFVDDDGLVDYAGLKADRRELDAWCEFYAGVDQAGYESWTDDMRMAFWINAYNAFTLKLIVDNYPIKPSTGKSKYPANSIRQIPGAWEHKKFKALGRDVTLDEIEHKILRAEFNDPRIHMALVCAAMSCPKLRRGLYYGEGLDEQLDEQARIFLSDLRKFHIDREAGEVWASPIFEWFVDDFLPGATKTNPRHIAQQKSLTAFASKYVSAEDARYLESGKYVVKYFEYDWTLNEQPK
jgi:hypothetical protein